MNETTDTRELKKNLPPAPALPYTFKTSFAHYGRIFSIPRIIIVLGVAGILWYQYTIVTALLFVLVIAIIAGIITYLLSSRSISIDESGVQYKNIFKKVQVIPFSEVDSVKVFFNYLDPAFGYTLRVIVATKSQQSLSVTGTFWSLDDIVSLISIMDSKKVTINYYQDAVSSFAIAKAFPKLVYPHQRHPFLVGLVLLLALIAVMTPLVISKILEISR